MAVRADDDRRRVALAGDRDDRLGDRDLGLLGDDQRVGLAEADLPDQLRPLLGAVRRALSYVALSISSAVRMSTGAGGNPMVAVGSSMSSNATPAFQTTSTSAERPASRGPASRSACSAAREPS